MAPSRTRPRRRPTSSCTSRRAVSTSARIARRERQQRLAGRGERDVAAAAVEQGGAEVGLQGVDLLAQRGLGHPDAVGRPGEVPRLGHGHEVSELLELHLHSLQAIDTATTMHWTNRDDRRPTVAAMAIATARRCARSVGLKALMAVTGLLLVLFLVAHMVGNLKIFFGADSFDHYAHWLRTIGAPLLPDVGVPVDPAGRAPRRGRRAHLGGDRR